MSRRRPNNPLALAVLTMLYEHPMHPYEMSRTLRERGKEASIRLNHGSLYSVVDSLTRRGLIEEKETIREGRRPERTVYDITDSGVDLMTEWLSELLRDPKPQFTDFEAAMSLVAALSPDEVLELLRNRVFTLRINQATNQKALEQLPESFPRLFLLEAEYQDALRSAELRFVEGLIDELEGGTLSGLQVWRRLHELRDSDTPPNKVQSVLMEEFPDQSGWLGPGTG